MITVPFVWLVSVLTTIAAFALAQEARLTGAARFFLCLFLLALAAIGVLLGFRLSFDAAWAARVQPFVAVMVAPSAYLGFAALTQDGGANWRGTLLVNGAPVVLVQLAMLADFPASADVFVLGITSFYLFRMARLLFCDADEFVHVAPNAMRILRLAIHGTCILLGMMVAADLLIVAASLLAGDGFIMTFLTGMSGVLTAFVFVAALVGASMLPGIRKDGAVKADEQPGDSDRAVMSALDALMSEKHIYTDSNLTLARVARRLSVPARDVSAAINRVTGENFSRYINGFRVRHAQKTLRETSLPITEVMFEAGFVSKSSFNTEFRRITGQTPSRFRAKGADG
ncbi:helix-turn-helix domain-containing protein [Roseibium marinum]|uniref:Helix-turn-helix protein n=1 Tax=Roseibium marinum TaxID=281252 RepID=A0A2S3V3L6_9HYPH|nr:AraC family transcriptional regulator [Roseibium marinum]POF34582.1 helix-turn-helix protein [Roseibium marinum]